jgi:hypothetical protein
MLVALQAEPDELRVHHALHHGRDNNWLQWLRLYSPVGSPLRDDNIVRNDPA